MTTAQILETGTQLEKLAAEFLAARTAETSAISLRRSIGEQIEKLLTKPFSGEGTVNEALDGMKLTATFKVGRKADTTALQLDWNDLPESVREVFYWEAKVSTTELRKLSEQDAKNAAQYITSKPEATQIAVQLTGEKSGI